MTTLIEEAGFFTILGEAMKAGNEAGDQWNLEDWYPCGNANILVKPRNSKFANWLLNNEFGHDSPGMKSIIIRAPNKYGQVMKAKTLWASAVAKVLREKYEINVTVWSYID